MTHPTDVPREPDTRFAGLRLVHRRRADARLEEWTAVEPSGDGGGGRSRPVVVVRLRTAPGPELRQALATASARVQRLHHPHLIRVESASTDGPVVGFVLEAVEGVRLSEVLAHAGAAGKPLPPALALWAAREVARTAEELSLDPSVRRGVGAHQIHAGADGAIRLGAFELVIAPLLGAPGPEGELEALGVLLEALLFAGTGEGQQLEATRKEVPLPAVQLAQRCRNGGIKDLRAAESALSRLFYAELHGDDTIDGQDALATRVKEVKAWLDRGDAGSTAVDEAPEDLLFATPAKGAFTRALESRNAPVVPQPLCSDDYEVSSAGKALLGLDAAEHVTVLPIERAPPQRVSADRALVEPPPPRFVAPPRPQGASTARSNPAVSSRSAEAIRAARGVPFAALWFALGFITALLVVATIQLTGKDAPVEAPAEVLPRAVSSGPTGGG